MATDIDIAALVTSDGCRASDPLSLLSPRLSPGLAILATPGPVSRGPGPASPDCQPGPRTGQITDPSLLIDSNTISNTNNKINQTSSKFDEGKLFGDCSSNNLQHLEPDLNFSLIYSIYSSLQFWKLKSGFVSFLN